MFFDLVVAVPQLAAFAAVGFLDGWRKGLRDGIRRGHKWGFRVRLRRLSRGLGGHRVGGRCVKNRVGVGTKGDGLGDGCLCSVQYVTKFGGESVVAGD